MFLNTENNIYIIKCVTMPIYEKPTISWRILSPFKNIHELLVSIVGTRGRRDFDAYLRQIRIKIAPAAGPYYRYQ